MSRVYWHSPSGEAKLHGSERAWLDYVARGPATTAWHLDSSNDLERSAHILAMVPEVPDGEYGANYLHRGHREAIAEHKANRAALSRDKPPFRYAVTSYDAQHRHMQSLKIRLRDLNLVIGEHKLNSADLELNTALRLGSDPVKLAAKIHGWCESHCYIEGPDREWIAGVIDEGLEIGVYRKGMWYVDRVHDSLIEGRRSEQPDAKFITQGWEDVLTHLRSRDDEPVVLSYSVCDQFPNAESTLDCLPPWPDGVKESWSALTEAQQGERERAQEAWYELSSEEQWEKAMTGLRANKSWARLSPETLGVNSFGPMITVYDLFAPDRDERVAAAFAVEDQ